MLRHLNTVEICKPSEWTTSHICLALWLGKLANESDECWPSVGWLADALHLSPSRVRQLLRDLEADGFIRRRHRPGRSTVYLWTMAPALPLRGVC